MKGCELCSGMARLHCESDSASLCFDCDAKVHGANFLVARHQRLLLCRACQSPTPWRADGPRLFPAASVCARCVGRGVKNQQAESRRNQEQEEEHEEEDIDDDEEEEDDDDDEEEEEEEEEQVVPWATDEEEETNSAPAASSSGSDEDLSTTEHGALKRRRERENEVDLASTCSLDHFSGQPRQLVTIGGDDATSDSVRPLKRSWKRDETHFRPAPHGPVAVSLLSQHPPI
ncbi:ribosomal RNA processing protein 1-like protein [Iris pallida]|uniref:Ribosomal RNA processing protein 1-like protein n=1 Tax=Iris pallida TaxID=29817 RepID=A0AAX6GFD0_IRIPA|nr:ribosomal RNA processing protein 1-like protein [Iris pallida]